MWWQCHEGAGQGRARRARHIAWRPRCGVTGHREVEVASGGGLLSVALGGERHGSHRTADIVWSGGYVTRCRQGARLAF